jgi:signal transduction histidine kinase
MDDATRNLRLPASVRATVSPAVTSLRWGAVGYGLAFSAPQAAEGSYAAVMATAVCLFLATWRTVLPVRLGSPERSDSLTALLDVVLLGLVVGADGGLASPYVFTVLAAVVVVTFGWGARRGLVALALAVVSMGAGLALGPGALTRQLDDQRDVAMLVVLALSVAAAAFLRSRLVDGEDRRTTLRGQVDRLSEANELLTLLNSAARTLPGSLTLREALDRSRRQLVDTFDARVVCLLTHDEHAEDWVPKLSDGCVLRPAYQTAELPDPLAEVLRSGTPLLVRDSLATPLATVAEGSGSGMYLPLSARGSVIGLLALEHPTADQWDDRTLQLLVGLADVLALTLDNARWFGRLRSLGAEEERVRIARDLHDRLGQWLTYISFELERIIGGGADRVDELDRLQGDVQSAIDELRETLRQLRAGVSEDRPLAVLGRDTVQRFAERSQLRATFTAGDPDERLPVPVENELLRILQEALNNVERHAKATSVEVTWSVTGGNFELVVRDDGRGFDTARGVRDSAYGLVGMRERADVIGARLEIDSRPGAGTTVRVVAGGAPAGGMAPTPDEEVMT